MPKHPSTPKSKFTDNLTPQDSKFVLHIPEMSEQEILEKLGYGAAIKKGGIEAAEAEFRQNHHNAEPTKDKLDEVLKQAIYDKEKFTGMGATNIDVAQTYSITTAASRTGVPAESIARLAIGERAFDKTFTNGRMPGLIQMKESDFLSTFAQYGGDCSRTVALHDQIPKDGAGKPKPITQWPTEFRDAVAKLQADPLASAQLGTMYAKNHPVQLDVVNTYMGETAARNPLQLGNLMRNVGGLTNSQVNIVLNPSDPEWCAATVDSAMMAAGIKPRLETAGERDPGKPTLLAKDYDKFGTAVPHPSGTTVRPGDVVVFDGIPHVAMVNSVDAKGNFTWLGGNQSSHHNVDVDGRANVHDPSLTFRRPPPSVFANAQSLPLPEPLPKDPGVNTAAPAATGQNGPVIPVIKPPVLQ